MSKGRETVTVEAVRRNPDAEGFLLLRTHMGEGEVGDVKFSISSALPDGSLVVEFSPQEWWVLKTRDLVKAVARHKGLSDHPSNIEP